MATAKLNVQHDYITLKAAFQGGADVNLTVSRSGLKASGKGLDGKDLRYVLNAFDKAWSAKAFGDNGKFMAAVLEAATASMTIADFTEKLLVMSKLPPKEIKPVEVEDLVLREVAPPKIARTEPLTQEELQAAFDLVRNKKDWKARIDRTIDVADLARVMEAIVHFTGTVPYEVAHPTNPNKVIVRAAGYRAGPCN